MDKIEKNDGAYYETSTKEILEIVGRARELSKAYYNTNYSDKGERRAILEELLGGIGEGVEIDTPFYVDYGKNIFIGNHVIININCTFVDNKPIRIGNKVLLASNVQIYTATHPVQPRERIKKGWKPGNGPFFNTLARPVEIKDNVWVGGGAIILPGVTVGENSVIGAGSVVNRSIPANCVAAGNPCKIIRQFKLGELPV